MTINHISEDKANNRLENLELMTMKDNCNYGTRNERISKNLKKHHANKRVAMKLLEDLTELIESAEPLDD